MKSITLFVLSLVLLSVHSQAEPPSNLRLEYKRTEALPDNVFLRSFLRSITHHQSGHESEDSILIVQSKLKFVNFEEAEEFYWSLVRMRSEMTTQHQVSMRDTLCPLDSPRPPGVQVYAVLDALDDKWDSLGRTYLLKIEQDLGPESYEYFVSWMKELKLNTTFIRFNHAETYKAADPNFVRQSICGRFDSRQSDL